VTKPCNLEDNTADQEGFEKRLMKQESLVLKKLREGLTRSSQKRRSQTPPEAERFSKTDVSVLLLGERDRKGVDGGYTRNSPRGPGLLSL
jgi:hypothetical protein